MVTDVKYIYHGMTFEKLKNLLTENKKIQSFPLVNNPVRLILLGSIQRLQLIELIERQVGKYRRMQDLSEEEENELKKPKSERFRIENCENSDVSDSDNNFTYNPAYESPENYTHQSKSIKLVRCGYGRGVKLQTTPPFFLNPCFTFVISAEKTYL